MCTCGKPKATGRLDIVVGGQYGSESKGNFASHIANEYDIFVRVGGPNAGHSFYYGDEKIVVQSLPCGWTNPDAWLVIGAGAVVSPEILLDEVERFSVFMPSIKSRLIVDGGATVLSHNEHMTEGGVDGELHKRIGSTGEGVGAARLGRIHRDPERFKLARDVESLKRYVVENTHKVLTDSIKTGKSVLIEGTQGSGLSLIHGPWPYCTTADTNASGIIADTGLAPTLVTGTMLVVRTYPIRVAGTSGPMRGEISWDILSSRLGKPVHEKTTVTKKTRRVSEWDSELFRKSVSLNQPTSIALGFLDYVNPADEGKTDYNALSSESLHFIEMVEEEAEIEMGRRVPVTMLGTGGPRWSVIDIRKNPGI